MDRPILVLTKGGMKKRFNCIEQNLVNVRNDQVSFRSSP